MLINDKELFFNNLLVKQQSLNPLIKLYSDAHIYLKV